MSIAPRKCLTSWKVCPGQPRRLGQIVQTESSGFTVGVPQIGHFFGGLALRRRLPLRWTSGAITCGMTSPARVTTTSSPSRTSLRARSSSLWRVAWLTVTPLSRTGSSWAKGTMLPTRPTFQTTFRSVVVAVIGGTSRRPPSAARGHDAKLAPERALVDLDDDAVDLVVEALAALLPPQAPLDDFLDALVRVDPGLDREAAVAQPVELVGVGGVLDSLPRSDRVRTRARAAAMRSPTGRACAGCPPRRSAGWRRQPHRLRPAPR